MAAFQRLFLTAGLAVVLAGVPLLAQDINVDYDHAYQFNQMKSYSWGKIQATDPLVEPRVAAAIDHVIQGYGFNESAKDKKGDVIVTAVLANNPDQYAAFYRNLNLDWHRGWGGGGFSDSASSLRQIHGGTLVIDVYDGATGKLVWRGTAAEGIASKERVNQDNVDKAVNTMFANYPPKSGGSIPPNQQEVPPSPSSTPLTSPN
jgi:hypothetical protein